MQQVLIVGTGAFAQGLASLASRSGATASYDITLGSRKMLPGQSGVLPGLEDTPVRSLEEELPQADMVRHAGSSSAMLEVGPPLDVAALHSLIMMARSQPDCIC